MSSSFLVRSEMNVSTQNNQFLTLPLRMLQSPNQAVKLQGIVMTTVLGKFFLEKGGHFNAPAAACFFTGLNMLLFVEASIKSVAVTQPTAPPLPEMTWKDLCFLAGFKHAFGFRNAGSLERANNEHIHGFDGDSLNLDITDNQVWKQFFPDDKPDATRFSTKDKMLLWPDRIPLDFQQKCLTFWTQGVDHFIDCLYTSPQTAFLLIDYGRAGKGGAYDLKYGNGLGKMGKRWVASDRVKAIIPPPGSKLPREKLTLYYRSMLISAIKRQAAAET